MTKFPNPPMYPSQVQLLEQNLTIKMKNNSWISQLALPNLTLFQSTLSPSKAELGSAQPPLFLLYLR